MAHYVNLVIGHSLWQQLAPVIPAKGYGLRFEGAELSKVRWNQKTTSFTKGRGHQDCPTAHFEILSKKITPIYTRKRFELFLVQVASRKVALRLYDKMSWFMVYFGVICGILTLGVRLQMGWIYIYSV